MSWYSLLNHTPKYPKITFVDKNDFSSKYRSRFTDKLVYNIIIYNPEIGLKPWVTVSRPSDTWWVSTKELSPSVSNKIINKMFATLLMENLL